MRKFLISGVAVLALAACAQGEKAETEAVAAAPAEVVEVVQTVSLDNILAAQNEAAQARYQYRNPKETLEFFGIKPGMTVVEALPGGGWYTKILLPLLGDEGALIGADYALDLWPNFGGFANAEFLEKKKTWPQTWTEGALEWRGGTNASVSAFAFGDRDTSQDGTADAALFIRAMHNLNRFSDVDDYMGEALADTHALLKTGGILGVVQHRAPEGNDDAWAKGGAGYLKQSALIATIEAAGFELVETSEINANPEDQPTNEDIVWRLPPSLGTSQENPELRAEMKAIGESDRMTLKFRKI